MKFKCELNDIDYSDKILLKALENISKDITYEFELSTSELEEIINAYLLQELNINLEESDIRLDLWTCELSYDNESEAKAVKEDLREHFGKSCISDNYTINPERMMRKIFKLATCERYMNMCVIQYYGADDFSNTWAYKYIQKQREEI